MDEEGTMTDQHIGIVLRPAIAFIEGGAKVTLVHTSLSPIETLNHCGSLIDDLLDKRLQSAMSSGLQFHLDGPAELSPWGVVVVGVQ
jgi:hypothetical protein